MIIKDIKKIKNKNEYIITIDDNVYKFNEDTILEFRLYKDKEISKDILRHALSVNNLNEYYNMALKYSYKYAKSAYEIRLYLMDKGLSEDDSRSIVNKLKDNKIIDDNVLIDSIIYSLIKNYNGKLMIEEKLKSKGFDFDLIDLKLSNLDYEFYFECLNKLYEKIKDKYNKEKNDYIRINKIKKYLYQKGYTSNDISNLEIR